MHAYMHVYACKHTHYPPNLPVQREPVQKEIQRETDRERQTERDRQTDREHTHYPPNFGTGDWLMMRCCGDFARACTERERDRQKERQREREREREREQREREIDRQPQ